VRTVYAIVFGIAFAALVAQHLTSPSSGRPVSPEDFAGACAPCGAPCPSVQKKERALPAASVNVRPVQFPATGE
jgi:hypothetical protein